MITNTDFRTWKWVTDYNYPAIGRVQCICIWFDSWDECEEWWKAPPAEGTEDQAYQTIEPWQTRARKWCVVPICDLNRNLNYDVERDGFESGIRVDANQARVVTYPPDMEQYQGDILGVPRIK